MRIIALIEHDRGQLAEVALQSLGFAQHLGATEIDALICGDVADDVVVALGAHGATRVWQASHEALADYDPEAWGEVCAALTARISPEAVVAVASERGGEVLAHVAAIHDLPLAANVTRVAPGDGAWALTRIRWGGSLLEEATIDAPIKLLTAAAHVFPARPGGGAATVEQFTPELAPTTGRTRITDRVTLASGITLTTAAVVVSGGRGVGSPEGFGKLEELAGLVNGAVGCSRVVTNNGWRPHADQVGQTGKRIAPELYIACGISGAIQHWVGMMAAKRVLAINSDGGAPMVTKADYAVIGDLHAIVPAISEEIRRRRA